MNIFHNRLCANEMAEILEFQQFAIIINNFVLGWADNFEIQWNGFPHGAHKACNQLKPAKETGTRIDVKPLSA